MDLNVYVHLIFLCVVNIIFSFTGIVSNTLVIASFWKSSQLRRKLCHFMIMVLSCFDLVAVVTIHSGILYYLILWLMEDYDLVPKVKMYLHISDAFLGFSFLALLVMSIERYLGAYYPIFHRTSVTRRRLLTLFAIFLIVFAVMYIISSYDLVISTEVFVIIFMVLFFTPFMFVNFKLLTIARKMHRAVSPGKKTTINLKNISTGLWAVACTLVLTILNSVFVAFNLAEKSTNTKQLSYIWMLTCNTMNCTFNSLIFFWKNKVLRTEGMKIVKTVLSDFARERR